ncbi:MAG TPA: hypothetical protein VEX15_23700 [Nocardioidaceae bacterium]|nr:hypothetical protein [Nocardioidaceae bacterium]
MDNDVVIIGGQRVKIWHAGLHPFGHLLEVLVEGLLALGLGALPERSLLVV